MLILAIVFKKSILFYQLLTSFFFCKINFVGIYWHRFLLKPMFDELLTSVFIKIDVVLFLKLKPQYVKTLFAHSQRRSLSALSLGWHSLSLGMLLLRRSTSSILEIGGATWKLSFGAWRSFIFLHAQLLECHLYWLLHLSLYLFICTSCKGKKIVSKS